MQASDLDRWGFRFLATGFLLAVWLMGSTPVRANPCAYPKRMVNGYTVDLQPLFDWWSSPKGARPLSGWKHVTGTIARELASGWVLNGKAEGAGQVSTFLLKNPPRERLRRFQELQRQLTQLEAARDNAMEMLRRPVLAPGQWSSLLVDGKTQPMSPEEHRQVVARLTVLDQNVRGIRGELAPMQDDGGGFKLDAFALRPSETFEGLPVFDHGYALPVVSR